VTIADDERETRGLAHRARDLVGRDGLGSAESVFNKTRVAISRASEGDQVPTVSSSLLEDVNFDQAGG
jgi:hypothetical protein